MLNSLKKRLEWVDELLGILWAYRTTSKQLTGVTSFALAYDMEAITPTEIGLPMVRTIVYESETNEGNLKMQLDWADEEREAATVQLTSYQQRTMA